MRIQHHTIKHTPYHHAIISQSGVNNSGFSGISIKNQPDILYKSPVFPSHWWQQGDLLKFIAGVTSYINVGMTTGFGIGETALNKGIVPKIIDRSSPFMWL